MESSSSNIALIIQHALTASRLSKRIGGRLSLHGLSFTEYLVMQYLSSLPHKSATRIALAEHLAMSASGVTRLIAPMEKTGLVELVPNPRDARQRQVKITDAGETIYSDSTTSFEHMCEELTANLSDSQVTKFIELNAALR